jgi:hypothetical protein
MCVTQCVRKRLRAKKKKKAFIDSSEDDGHSSSSDSGARDLSSQSGVEDGIND